MAGEKWDEFVLHEWGDQVVENGAYVDELRYAIQILGKILGIRAMNTMAQLK